MRAHYERWNGRKLIVSAFVVLGIFFGVLIWRGWAVSSSDARICRKVDRLTNGLISFVQKSPPPSDPQEYAQRVKLLAALRAAACDPANLPSVGK